MGNWGLRKQRPLLTIINPKNEQANRPTKSRVPINNRHISSLRLNCHKLALYNRKVKARKLVSDYIAVLLPTNVNLFMRKPPSLGLEMEAVRSFKNLA